MIQCAPFFGTTGSASDGALWTGSVSDELCSQIETEPLSPFATLLIACCTRMNSVQLRTQTSCSQTKVARLRL